MAANNDKKPRPGSSSRTTEIEAVVRELATLRGAGQTVDYSAVERAHSELMPELGDRLRLLRAMDVAATSPQNGSSSIDVDELALKDENSAIEFLCHALDGYEMLDQVDYGGQGRVFRAVQRATNRTVAIKVLLDGPLASKRQRDRFSREIELISRLKDPGIVTVYDSGTVRGRPYLVMEFVDGLPIDDYVLAERPDVEGRIRLFLKVCHAIAVAHRRGIIHRDLKPANILVDGTGRVHVLDFGLAKELQERAFSGSKESLSDTGQIIGTLRYLSPEQAWGQNDKIDTRSDVYTLGIVLFEMLTGLPPYPTNGHREEVLRRIRLLEPCRLSKAIEMTGGDGVVATKHIDRDLEIIVARCMKKEPERRYQSVLALSEDLERYLRGDAIEARAASGLYLLSKTFRKFRVHVTIAAAFLFLLVGALVGMTILYKRTVRIADIAKKGLLVGGYTRGASVVRDAGEPDMAISLLEQAHVLDEFASTDDPLVRRQAFHFHHVLAELYIKKNRLEESLVHCDKASELTVSLRRDAPDELEWLRFEGFTHKLYGQLANAHGRWSEAKFHFLNMLPVRREIAEREPGTPSWSREVAEAHRWIAKAARKNGQLAEAEKHYLDACDIYNQLSEDDPTEANYAIEQSDSDVGLGITYLSGNTDDGNSDALACFVRAKQRLTKLLNSPYVGRWAKEIKKRVRMIDGRIAALGAGEPPTSG
ncbi:MAG: serine/threonine protein kinase [Planctomycetes bacterium]|nr:serine/threonine protein kinase [Planctomycetota bacterium]